MSRAKWNEHTKYERDRIQYTRVANECISLQIALDEHESAMDDSFERRFELQLREAERQPFMDNLKAELASVECVEGFSLQDDDPMIVEVFIDRAFGVYRPGLIISEDGDLWIQMQIKRNHSLEVAEKFAVLVESLLHGLIRDLERGEKSDYVLCLRVEDM